MSKILLGMGNGICRGCGEKVENEISNRVVINVPHWDRIAAYLVCEECKEDGAMMRSLQLIAIADMMKLLEEELERLHLKYNDSMVKLKFNYTHDKCAKEVLIGLLEQSESELKGFGEKGK